MEKQAYASVKALKELRVYIMHSHSTVFVPSVAIKDILIQARPDGRRAKWIATLLEYDIEIRPTKLVNGKGLAFTSSKLVKFCSDYNIILSHSTTYYPRGMDWLNPPTRA